MSNIHGLSSLRDNASKDDDQDENNRYVGGVSSLGGGSGLAVEPNTANNGGANDILGAIRSNAEVAQPPSSPSSGTTRRMITMYRSGFTIDDGPYRRLDDPSNAEFLRDLARGVTPRELFSDRDDDSSANRDMEVGLVDKRQMEYEDDGARGSGTASAAAFSGVGQSLGSSTPSEGVIERNSGDRNEQVGLPPTPDESKPITTVQIRLHTGKRLIVKCNFNDTIQTLVLHIEAAGVGDESYVLSSGYPPQVLNDLTKTIEECGLKNAQVVQKKA